MTSRTDQPEPHPRKATSPRRPVERVLPATMIERLKIEVRQSGQASARLVRELDQRYHIERDHGITRRRLRNFLAKLVAGMNAGGASENSVENEVIDKDPPDSFAHRLRNHRVRQASVASILDKTFGKLAECAPDLWGHRAYLMLVGMVYERLAINEEDVSTEELVALAKVIAENRRLEVRLRELRQPESDNGQATAPEGPLPDHFGDIVRRVYGTNFAEAAQTRPTDRARASCQ